jgi:hypothetical protein
LAIDLFRRLFSSANIDPPRRSRRLQGLPPENMEGDIPRSTEQSPQQGEVQNITISREDTFVTTADPTSVAPLEPLLLRLDSLGNVIDEEVPRLPERPFTEAYMGSTQPIFGEEYRTENTNPTPARSIWRTPSGRSLYEHFESLRQPFHPDNLPGEAGPSSQTMSHPVDRLLTLLFPSKQPIRQ